MHIFKMRYNRESCIARYESERRPSVDKQCTTIYDNNPMYKLYPIVTNK